MDREITLEEIAESFGTTTSDFSKDCLALIKKTNLKIHVPSKEERDQILLTVVKILDRTDLDQAGEHNRQKWEKGWGENLEEYKQSGNLEALVPRFIHPGRPIRWRGDYVVPSNERFEHDYFDIFRQWIFAKYFSNLDAVYEFGCGTGFNLVVLARMFPTMKVYGFDWATSAIELVNKLARDQKADIQGKVFDFFNPDESVKISPNSAVLTMGAMEQVGDRFERLLDYFLRNSPSLCVHMEPTPEFYDTEKLTDYLAHKYHHKRGYLRGYFPRLQELEKQGRIEILKAKRLYFGSLLHEGFSYYVWRPKGDGPRHKR